MIILGKKDDFIYFNLNKIYKYRERHKIYWVIYMCGQTMMIFTNNLIFICVRFEIHINSCEF